MRWFLDHIEQCVSGLFDGWNDLKPSGSSQTPHDRIKMIKREIAH